MNELSYISHIVSYVENNWKQCRKLYRPIESLPAVYTNRNSIEQKTEMSTSMYVYIQFISRTVHGCGRVRNNCRLQLRYIDRLSTPCTRRQFCGEAAACCPWHWDHPFLLSCNARCKQHSGCLSLRQANVLQGGSVCSLRWQVATNPHMIDDEQSWMCGGSSQPDDGRAGQWTCESWQIVCLAVYVGGSNPVWQMNCKHTNRKTSTSVS